MHEKLKLKGVKESRRKRKRDSGKRKVTQMADTISNKNIKNIKTGNRQNDSSNINCTDHVNNSSNEINEECVGINSNPFENSQQLFQWLLHPVDIRTFFK